MRRGSTESPLRLWPDNSGRRRRDAGERSAAAAAVHSRIRVLTGRTAISSVDEPGGPRGPDQTLRQYRRVSAIDTSLAIPNEAVAQCAPIASANMPITMKHRGPAPTQTDNTPRIRDRISGGEARYTSVACIVAKLACPIPVRISAAPARTGFGAIANAVNMDMYSSKPRQ